MEESKNRVRHAADELGSCKTGSIGETQRRAELEKQIAMLNADLVTELSSRISELTNNIQEGNEASGKLQNSVVKLNIILAIATAVGAFATVIIAISEFNQI